MLGRSETKFLTFFFPFAFYLITFLWLLINSLAENEQKSDDICSKFR